MINDSVVPQTGQDRSNRRFADFAAVAPAVVLDQFVERLDSLDLDDLEQLLP